MIRSRILLHLMSLLLYGTNLSHFPLLILIQFVYQLRGLRTIQYLITIIVLQDLLSYLLLLLPQCRHDQSIILVCGQILSITEEASI